MLLLIYLHEKNLQSKSACFKFVLFDVGGGGGDLVKNTSKWHDLSIQCNILHRASIELRSQKFTQKEQMHKKVKWTFESFCLKWNF